MAFKESTIVSFQAARQDHEQLKQNMNDWVQYLDQRQEELEFSITALETKLQDIELLLRESIERRH